LRFWPVLNLAKLIAPAACDWLKDLLARAEGETIIERIVACRDPTDDKFLVLAVNGSANLIVSGDADLQVLNPFRGIPILSPGAPRCHCEERLRDAAI
jgi:predicted nucleic acid-binding protein